MAEAAATRVSFFSKKETLCPVCGTQFFREDLLTGRGRLIAGELTNELRRVYEPSQKYGVVTPLIYPVMVCPGCYYAAFPADFLEISEATRSQVEEDADRRISSVRPIFDELDFREPRTIKEGVASYFFAMTCYDFFPPEVAPTIKQGICALRTAWLFNDLHRQDPSENFDYLAKLFYRKARFLYSQTLDYEQSGHESVAQAAHLGPDLDQNYAYDGVVYLAAYLELKFGPTGNEERRIAALQRAKTTVARLFGMGKASKQKPSAILAKARDRYQEIREELNEEGEEEDDAGS